MKADHTTQNVAFAACGLFVLLCAGVILIILSVCNKPEPVEPVVAIQPAPDAARIEDLEAQLAAREAELDALANTAAAATAELQIATDRLKAHGIAPIEP